MRARWKFLLQGVIALGASLILKYGLKPPEMILPNYPEVIELGIWYIPIAMFIIIGTSNAVNLTDGLDGLAGLIAAMAFAAYGAVAALQGQIWRGRGTPRADLLGALLLHDGRRHFRLPLVQRLPRGTFHG